MGRPLPELNTQRRTVRRRGSEDTANHANNQSGSVATGSISTTNKPDKGKVKSQLDSYEAHY